MISLKLTRIKTPTKDKKYRLLNDLSSRSALRISNFHYRIEYISSFFPLFPIKVVLILSVTQAVQIYFKILQSVDFLDYLWINDIFKYFVSIQKFFIFSIIRYSIKFPFICRKYLKFLLILEESYSKQSKSTCFV